MILASSTHMMPVPETTDQRDATQEGQHDEWRAPGYQPIIGIPIPIQQGTQGPLLVADAVGAWAVERMRGRILLIPLWPFPTHKYLYQSLWQLLQSMDGLLLPAGLQGTDWYPVWNAREQHPGPESWPLCWEIALAQLATYLGMPILAIGDGAEKWNSALGGRRGDVAEDLGHMAQKTPDTWARHTIRVRAHSRLATALQPAIVVQEGEQQPWELAFMPHQGVEQVAPGLRSCALSEEEAVVGFERRDDAFGLGIVGRVDWGLDQAYGTTLFEAFLQACQSFDRVRRQQQGWEAGRETICATVSDLVTQGLSLIPLPHQPLQEEKRLRARPLSAPLPAGREGERVRQRSAQPTKEEWNKIRRQRLKATSR